MKNFQIIILIVFIVAAVIGVLAFSGAIPLGNQSGGDGTGGTVVLWGTVKSTDIAKALEDFNKANQTYIIQYVQKQPETFDQELLEALASGKGPDLFFITDALAYKYSNKILTVPYQSYPLAVFRQNFVGAGEVFLTSAGSLAFPIGVDPMVMYYSRSVLDANNIVYPPEYWDQLTALVPVLTKKDETGKIQKSAVAFGQYVNIENAKDILATLFMQLGDPIVVEKNSSFISVLGSNNGKYDISKTLEFYTDFANPLKDVYSWNRSLPNSQDAFSKEDVAFYFGFASELRALIQKNPNQNFMVAPMPQIKNAGTKLTLARVTGVAISAFLKNLNSAFSVAGLLATGDFAKQFADTEGVAPARRDLLTATPGDAYQSVFYSSALYAKSWLDPSPVDTDSIFKEMVEKILSGNATPYDSIKEASAKLSLLFTK